MTKEIMLAEELVDAIINKFNLEKVYLKKCDCFTTLRCLNCETNMDIEHYTGRFMSVETIDYLQSINQLIYEQIKDKIKDKNEAYCFANPDSYCSLQCYRTKLVAKIKENELYLKLL